MTDNNQDFEEFLDKPKSSHRTAWIVAILIVLFFVALTVISTDWAMGALIHTRKEVKVPDLTKKTVTQALDLLSAQNLALKQAGKEFGQDVPPGSVLRQIPTPGAIVREGRVIRVWVSQGDEMVFVPNTVGTDLRDAQLAIRQAGLLVDKVENAYSLTVEKGKIISQKPAADSMVQKGEKVALTLSNGQPPSSVILVPNFVGKKMAEATLWASTQNINLIIKEDPNSAFARGTVAMQTPKANEQITPESSIEIVVSRRAISNEKSYHLHYEMPQGKKPSVIRITVETQGEETEVLNESKNPGSKIDLEIPYLESATIRIFSDEILVREREVQ